MSRRELLQRAGAGSLALSLVGSGIPDLAMAAYDTTVQKPGGVLRVGMSFGVSASLDPHKASSGSLDESRMLNVFSRLTDFDRKGDVVMQLAESIEPNKTGTRWLVKLRDDVVFHDGSPLTADDVIYSYRRILTKKLGLEGFADLSMIDPSRLRKVDRTTLLIFLKYPYADLPSQLGQRTTSILKAGTRSFRSLNGTGPFKFGKAVTGRSTTLLANRNYFVTNRPFVDRVELINISDETARLNALSANQVDAIPVQGLERIAVLKNTPGVKYVISPSDGWATMVMNIKERPFNDVRVRQALRLIADRPQIRAQAQQGLGRIGNDLFGLFDPMYASSIPQRTQDIDRARSLLRAAGYEDLQITLESGEVAPATLSSALVFAEQAKAAGVTIKVNNNSPDTYWTNVWGKQPFVQTYWAHRPLIGQWLQVLDPAGPWTSYETRWDDPKTTKRFREAVRTVDEKRRAEIMHEVQLAQWNRGGNLIWGFIVYLDAYRSNVRGTAQNANRRMDNWGWANLSVR